MQRVDTPFQSKVHVRLDKGPSSKKTAHERSKTRVICFGARTQSSFRASPQTSTKLRFPQPAHRKSTSGEARTLGDFTRANLTRFPFLPFLIASFFVAKGLKVELIGDCFFWPILMSLISLLWTRRASKQAWGR